MRLEDLVSGQVKLGPGAAVSYNGVVYRGKDLKELVARHKNDLSTEEIQGESAPAPDGGSSKSKSSGSAGK